MERHKTPADCSNLHHSLTIKSDAMFPQLGRFVDFGLLALRLMVAVVFTSSGWSHATKSEERSKSLGMSKGFTVFLGVAEVTGGLGVAFGVLTQLAALGFDPDHAGCHSEENFRLAYRFLGRESLGLAL